jgi:hypothetical protein
VLQFERAIVALEENGGRITAERSLFGFSVFTTTSGKVNLQDGKLTALNTGGSIGRLPIHPLLMKYSDPLFADLWAALDREKKALTKMAALELRPQAVVVTPKP